MRTSVRRDLVLFVVVVLIAVWVAALVTTSSGRRAGTPISHASVIDGDTIQIDGRIVPLYGIDAPALGQRCYHDDMWIPCGLDAAFELNKLIRIEGGEIDCAPAATSRHRSAEVCFAGDVDLADALLKSGYVVADSETTEGYRETENAARQARLGLWHSQFVAPAEWRKGSRLPGESGHETDACPVKATISANGDRLYYVPTDSDYLSVQVDPSKGGRFFCSSEQARQAGWRRQGEKPAEGRVDLRARGKNRISAKLFLE